MSRPGSAPEAAPLSRQARRAAARAAARVVPDTASCQFDLGARVTIAGTSLEKYEVTFTDTRDGRVVFRAPCAPGHWVHARGHSFVPWLVVVRNPRTGVELLRHTLDLRGQRVYVDFGSPALGDTVAWFPYLEPFAEAHGCRLTVTTAFNDLFAGAYPQFTFVDHRKRVSNIHASYKVDPPTYVGHSDLAGGAWLRRPGGLAFWVTFDELVRLQRPAADALDVPFVEMRPRVGVRWRGARSGVVGIGPHCGNPIKYWRRPGGWEAVVAQLRQHGYSVKILSKESDRYRGLRYPTGAARLRDYRIRTVAEELAQCQAFVGLDSGLMWLAWAVGVPAAAIMGPTPAGTLPSDVLRIASAVPGHCKECCVGRRLSPAQACPEHEHDEREYECTRTIPPEQVLAAVETLLAQPRPTSAPAEAAQALAVEAAP